MQTRHEVDAGGGGGGGGPLHNCREFSHPRVFMLSYANIGGKFSIVFINYFPEKKRKTLHNGTPEN